MYLVAFLKTWDKTVQSMARDEEAFGEEMEKFKSRGNKWRQKCLCSHIVSNLTVFFPDMPVVIYSS